ncbi:MAG: gamma-glutamylcyclotransferase family protein [Deltaproteobacteria bacterium]|nr:gamma-glutamylcyclotransferase family protein [Deltaproteobacteria bacterium]
MNEKSLVFLYGTLKRGFGNHHFLDGSRFLGKAITKKKYALYVSGIPFVIENEPVSQISGEVYEVDEDTLARLDRLEGHPDWYCRKWINLIMERGSLNDVEKVNEAWIYFFPHKEGVLVKSGVFE